MPHRPCRFCQRSLPANEDDTRNKQGGTCAASALNLNVRKGEGARGGGSSEEENAVCRRACAESGSLKALTTRLAFLLYFEGELTLCKGLIDHAGPHGTGDQWQLLPLFLPVSIGRGHC